MSQRENFWHKVIAQSALKPICHLLHFHNFYTLLQSCTDTHNPQCLCVYVHARVCCAALWDCRCICIDAAKPLVRAKSGKLWFTLLMRQRCGLHRFGDRQKANAEAEECDSCFLTKLDRNQCHLQFTHVSPTSTTCKVLGCQQPQSTRQRSTVRTLGSKCETIKAIFHCSPFL